MTATAKWMIVALVAAVLLVAGGWWLCHAQGVSAATTAKAATDSTDRRWADSVAALNRLAMQRDSAARQDSARAETLSQQQVAEHVRRVAAELREASATLQLGQARTAADSLPIYRDSLVPALHSEVASLTRELVASDSGRLAYRDAFQQQIIEITKYRNIVIQDSGVIAAQRIALDKAARVSPVVFDVWQKLGYAGETAGYGVVTVAACQAHITSIACIVGTALTVRRLIAAKGKL